MIKINISPAFRTDNVYTLSSRLYKQLIIVSSNAAPLFHVVSNVTFDIKRKIKHEFTFKKSASSLLKDLV